MAVYLGSYEVSSTGSYNPTTEAVDAVRFIDYDGEIIESYSAEDFLLLTEMPENPVHTGLVAQGWNWTLQDAKAYVQEWGFLDIGQSYTTSSGATEIDIELLKGRTSPHLKIAVNGSVTVNWGDNTTSTITGTSYSSMIATQHNYANPGNYTITITINNGGWSLYPNSSYSIINGDGSLNTHYASSVTAIRIGNGNIRFGYSGCANMTRLKYITIPTTVYLNGVYGFFSNCYCLKAIIFPLTTERIYFNSNSMFNSCYNLRYICFSNRLELMYTSGQFQSCYNLKRLYFPETCSFSTSGKIIDDSLLVVMNALIIPARETVWLKERRNITARLSNMNSIQNNQFSGLTDLSSAVIPDNINAIGSDAFDSCPGLSSVSLPNNSTILQSTNIFSGCYALTEINIPNTLTSIGSSVFYNNYALSESITLPNSVTTFGNNNFYKCYSLSSLTFSNAITTCGTYTGGDCYNLGNITLPTSLTSIGTYCFTNCRRFTDITIPNTVTSIGNYSFQYCYGLKELHIKPTTPPTIGQYTFRNLPSDCTIYVPSASLSTYQSAANWSNFASQMVGE